MRIVGASLIMIGAWLAPVSAGTDDPPRVEALSFAALPGFAEDDHLAAFATFAKSCAALLADRPALRTARPPAPSLKTVCAHALSQPATTRAEARYFFERFFTPYRIAGATNEGGFFTGYYEPEVDGSLTPEADFAAPILARPDDLVSATPGEALAGLESGLSAGRARPDGTFAPYPERAAIEAGAIAGHTKPLLWLRDKVEVFLIQVQGSARVRLADGRLIRLVYAGRNGQPYSSIGRILVAEDHVPPEGIGMEKLKSWIRTHGQGEEEPGGQLMARNKSYVFFAIDQSLEAGAGPIGGAGLPLTPLRSIAIDRAIWPYGLPVWIDADMPWQGAAPTPMRRLMVAQDTGSAILGSARADIFFGSGDAAGLRAGEIRHKGAFIVLWPREEGSLR